MTKPAEALTPCEGVPEAEAEDRQAHELARRHGQSREDRERDDSVGVEEPDGEEQERDGERDRMNRTDRARRDPWISEVRDRENAGHAL